MRPVELLPGCIGLVLELDGRHGTTGNLSMAKRPQRVGCAGILVADTFCGPMTALPAAGELLAVDAMPSKAGGCAANVAIDLRKQDIEVKLLGCLGRDNAALMLRSCLVDAGVDCGNLVEVPDLPTSRTVILLVKGQDRRYIHLFGANAAFSVGHLTDAWLADVGVLYIGGLFAMPGMALAELNEVLARCRARDILTVVDVVVPRDFSAGGEFVRVLPQVDCFLPNEDEAALLTGLRDTRDQLRWLLDAGVRLAVVSRGERGVMAAQGQDLWSAPAYSTQPRDPSGAGDAFASGIITGLVLGWDVPTILPYASALGMSATRAIGTTDSVFRRAEAQAHVRSQPLPVQHGGLGPQ